MPYTYRHFIVWYNFFIAAAFCFCPLFAGDALPAGGYTNQTRFDQLDGQRVFIKIKSPEAAQLGSSWSAEIRANQVAHELGFAPAILVINDQNQQLIFQALEPVTSPVWNEGTLHLLVQELQLLHKSTIALAPFIPSKVMQEQLRNIQMPPALWKKEADLALQRVKELETIFHYQCKAPCHLDLWSSNVLQTNFISNAPPQLWLIDWEYAALSDPAYELANFSAVDALDEDLQRHLLSSYYHQVNAELWRRHIAYQTIALWRWSVWFGLRAELYKDESSWSFAQQYMMRANRLYQTLEPRMSPVD